MADDKVTKELIGSLLDGTLPDAEVQRLQRMRRKDEGRFWAYLETLRQRVAWEEPILLRLTDHLYIVRKGSERIVKCNCGAEFGDYRANWKLKARVRVRKTEQEFRQVYTPEFAAPEPGWVEIREYYCPGCVAQLAVEVVPPGYPPIFDMLPDIDSFYRDSLGSPLKDENQAWFRDLTNELTGAWAKGAKS
jgi:acetone carboxylase, gamma subunit